MKVYNIKVNGKVFQVEVESVSAEDGKKIGTAAQAPDQQAPVQQAPVSAGSAELKAPMAGTINDVRVQVGQVINKGDVVVILEAMKLENEVKSPASGTVKAVLVSKGQTVTNGQKIIIIG